MTGGFSHALVTGAGSGIGRSLCLRLRQQGVCVWAIDRCFQGSPDSASVIQGCNIVADVNESTWISSLSGSMSEPFDLVVHCAGISEVGRFESNDSDALKHVLETNLIAPMQITRELLNRGYVTSFSTHVFIASLSCFTGYPGASAYAASKDGLWSFARCLARVLGPSRGHVLAVFPGPTDTAHAIKYSPDNRRRHRRLCPDVLAAGILRAALAKKSVLFGRKREACLAWLAYLAPGSAARLMARLMYRIRLPDAGSENLR